MSQSFWDALDEAVKEEREKEENKPALSPAFAMAEYMGLLDEFWY